LDGEWVFAEVLHVRGAGDLGERPDDSSVVQGAAVVLAAVDLGGVCGIDQRGVEADGLSMGRGAVLEGEGDGVALNLDAGNLDWDGLGGSVEDGTEDPIPVRAVDLCGAVDDRLWGVNIVLLEGEAVFLLALGEVGRGETVAPAEAVPVVDVLAENDDVGSGNGLGTVELSEDGIGGRATGAAF